VKRSVHELVVLLSCFSKCFLLSCSLFFELGSLKLRVYVLVQLIHDVHRFAIALLLALQRELIPVPLEHGLELCFSPLPRLFLQAPPLILRIHQRIFLFYVLLLGLFLLDRRV